MQRNFLYPTFEISGIGDFPHLVDQSLAFFKGTYNDPDYRLIQLFQERIQSSVIFQNNGGFTVANPTRNHNLYDFQLLPTQSFEHTNKAILYNTSCCQHDLFFGHKYHLLQLFFVQILYNILFFFRTKTLISHPSFSLKYRLASLQYFLCELCYARVISHRHLSCDPVKRQRTTQASPTNLFPLISFFLDLSTLRRNTDCLTQIPKAIQLHTIPI